MRNYISPKYTKKNIETNDVITTSYGENVNVEVVNNGKEDVTVFSFSLNNIFKK